MCIFSQVLFFLSLYFSSFLSALTTLTLQIHILSHTLVLEVTSVTHLSAEISSHLHSYTRDSYWEQSRVQHPTQGHVMACTVQGPVTILLPERPLHYLSYSCCSAVSL